MELALVRGSALESQLAAERAYVHAQVVASRMPPRPENTPNLHLRHPPYVSDGAYAPAERGDAVAGSVASSVADGLKRTRRGWRTGGGVALEGFLGRLEARASPSLLAMMRSNE